MKKVASLYDWGKRHTTYLCCRSIARCQKKKPERYGLWIQLEPQPQRPIPQRNIKHEIPCHVQRIKAYLKTHTCTWRRPFYCWKNVLGKMQNLVHVPCMNRQNTNTIWTSHSCGFQPAKRRTLSHIHPNPTKPRKGNNTDRKRTKFP
jgi:hypothetical protein